MKEALEGKRYVEQYVQNLTHEIKSPLSAIRGAADEGLAVKGDGFLLHQAVANLLQNAVDFSPEGGVVRIEARSADARAIIAVTDEGPGAPPFAQDKIFDKFFSLQRPDTGKKSTGLGLNFVREVATLHGGEVRLENGTGAGTVAILEIER